MAQRLKGFAVTLETDLREDDAERILNAIRQVKGVCSVEPVGASIDDEMNRSRLRYEIIDRFYRDMMEWVRKG